MASRSSVIGSILTRLWISLSRSKTPLTSDQWESARGSALNLLPRIEVDQEFDDGEAEGLEATIHWLTAVCFLEEINPRELRLEPLLAERLIQETQQLEDLEPLVASTVCLKMGRGNYGINTELED